MVLKNVTPNSDITAWTYIKNKELPTVIYFYGNAESLAVLNSLGQLDQFTHIINCNFIFFDYPSYGNSTGKPSQDSLVNPGLKLVDWVADNYPQSPIIIWGRSLGAGVASQVIEKKNDKITKFVLISPWNSLTNLANQRHPILSKLFPKDILKDNLYDSYKALLNNDKPGLILYSNEDKIVPSTFTKDLLRKLSDSKIKSAMIKGVGHNDIYKNETWEHIRQFLN